MAGCGKQVDTIEERNLLLQTDREFSQYSVAHGAAEAFRTFLLQTAVQLPAGKNPLYGRDNIYKDMLKTGTGYTLSWQPEDGGVSSSGDLGYTWGIYTITIKGKDSNEGASKGKYLNVWKRDAEGNWRVLIDTGNQNPPD
jgi:ketosteroid isomerase-like protein